MAAWVEYNLPCPCGKSSDALSINDKGWGKCFSCGKNFDMKKDDRKEDLMIKDGVEDQHEVIYSYKPQRGLTSQTCTKWDIVTKEANGKDIAIGFTFANGAVKLRNFTDNKKERFSWKKNEQGEIGRNLYGWDLRKGPQKVNTLIITEGLIDAPSIDQVVMGVDVIAVDSSSSAYGQLSSVVEEINKYKRIVVAFDDDDVGNKATKTILSLFQDHHKLYRMLFSGCKDANELLQKDPSGTELQGAYIAIQKIGLTDFIHTFAEVAESLKEQHHDIVAPYPIPELQNLLRGLVRGRVTVWKGLEGIGKTEVFRLIEYNTIKQSKAKVAVIHMEESRDWTIKGMATYEANQPMYFTEEGVTEEEILDAYKKAVGEEDRFYIYKVRGSEDPNEVLVAIRNIVVSTGVDVVFLDNIQKLVDGIGEEDVRQKLVYLSAKLKDMASELNIAIEIISHVNDDGKALNSRYITKVFDRVIHMSRSITATDEIEKNLLYFVVEKNRGGKGSGPAGVIKFNTGMFKYEY